MTTIHDVVELDSPITTSIELESPITTSIELVSAIDLENS